MSRGGAGSVGGREILADDMKIEDLASMFRGTTFPYGPGCPEITKRHAATADWDTGAK